jgi:hypothetical protein
MSMMVWRRDGKMSDFCLENNVKLLNEEEDYWNEKLEIWTDS